MILIGFNCFNNPSVCKDALKRFDELTDYEGLDVRKVLVNSCYPLPDLQENKLKYQRMAESHWWRLLELDKNHGQNINFNLMVDFLRDHYQPAKNDILACWEPDCVPSTRSWLKDCVKAIEKAPYRCGFVTPHRKPEWVLNNQGQEFDLDGLRAKRICWPGGWPMGIYSWSFIEDMKQLPCKMIYGGTEAAILHALNMTNYIGLMLCDVEDYMTSQNFDHEYIGWKAETSHKTIDAQQDFVDWLKVRGRLP